MSDCDIDAADRQIDEALEKEKQFHDAFKEWSVAYKEFKNTTALVSSHERDSTHELCVDQIAWQKFMGLSEEIFQSNEASKQ